MMATGSSCNKVNDDNDSFLLMSYLDEVDDRIEELRRNALSLAQEKDSLLTILSQLKDDRLRYSLSADESYEILTSIEQLKSRCQNIEINITTARTSEQESSYLLVNSLVSKLELLCRQDDSDTKTNAHQAQGYLNACVSDGIPQGSVDYKFQGMILGCNLDDQKFFRHRLECLVKGNCHAYVTDQNLRHEKPCSNADVDDEQHLHDQTVESSTSVDTPSSSSD